MQLPNLQEAAVPWKKVTDYLLSTEHEKGRHKAAFFLRHGFTSAKPQELVDALLNHARTYPVSKEEPSPFGTRYVIEGRIKSPDGRDPRVRAVWFVGAGATTPRFATAYPLTGESDA